MKTIETFCEISDEEYQNKTINEQVRNNSIHGMVVFNLSCLNRNITFLNCHFPNLKIQGASHVQNFWIKFIDCDFDGLTIENTLNAKQGIFIQSSQANAFRIKTFSIAGENNIISIDNYKIEKLVFMYSYNHLVAGVGLNNCDIDLIGLQEGLSNPIRVDCCSFYKCNFDQIVGFNEIKFLQQIEFIKSSFKDISDNTHSTFRYLKNNFTENSNDFLSNMFASYELKSKFNGSNKFDDIIETILNYFYLCINDFGLDKYRPIYILAGISFLVLAGTGSIHDAIVFIAGPSRVLTKDFDYLTICNSLSRFGLSALSGILWVFIVLGIRKRFKIDG